VAASAVLIVQVQHGHVTTDPSLLKWLHSVHVGSIPVGGNMTLRLNGQRSRSQSYQVCCRRGVQVNTSAHSSVLINIYFSLMPHKNWSFCSKTSCSVISQKSTRR